MCAPLLVTTRGTILEGYARWQAAVERGHSNLPCWEVDLTDEEATVFILEHQRTSSYLNGYCRVLLALPLEGFFRRRNRGLCSKVGTRRSSKLTNVRRTDVRIDIARVADVSTGNVSKVKQLRHLERTGKLPAVRVNGVRLFRRADVEKLRLERQERGRARPRTD